MMSGLRSQRDRMMTWVSLRSGMASSGRCIMDQAPQAQAAATSAKTRNLFFTENSITRLSISASARAQNLCEVAYLHSCVCVPGGVLPRPLERPAERRVSPVRGALVRVMRCRGRRQQRNAHAALRIDQEIPRNDDPLTGFQAAGDRDVVAVGGSERYLAPLEHTLAAFHVNDFLHPAVEDSLLRNGDAGRGRDTELQVYKHVRPED